MASPRTFPRSADQTATPQTGPATQHAEFEMEKVQAEHDNRIDPLGADLMLKISMEEVQADFFVPLTNFSSENVTEPGLLLTPSIDFANDPCAALGIATDLNIHRRSTFLDYLTVTPEEHVEQMQNYPVYAALRNPVHQYSSEGARASDVRTGRSLKLDQAEQVRVTENKSGLASDRSIFDFPWTFDWAHKDILQTIQAIPKAKKKKKRVSLSRHTPDSITPEEAYLDYQIVVAEEKLRQEFLIYQKSENERLLNEDRLIKIRKRYDDEIEVCKTELAEEEAQFKVLKNEWRDRIGQAEAKIAQTETELALTVSSLASRISEEEHAIVLLRKESAVWISFREGAMLRNQTKMEKLSKAIVNQKQDRDDHLRLTDEAVHLAEESAKKAEEKAMNDLCQRHIQGVCESLPPEEIQEIENSTILTAELKTLDMVFWDLTTQTESLQRKIIHQAATAQTMLESINNDNANILKFKLFDQNKPEQSIVGKVEDLNVTADVTFTTKYMYEHFQDLHQVQAMTGGLTVIGTNRKVTKISLGQQLMQQAAVGGSLLAADLRPGFVLNAASFHSAGSDKQSSHHLEFMDEIDNPIVQSEQKLFFGHGVNDFDDEVEVVGGSEENKSDSTMQEI